MWLVSFGVFLIFIFLNNKIVRDYKLVRAIEETGRHFAVMFERILSIDVFILIEIITTLPAIGLHNHRTPTR